MNHILACAILFATLGLSGCVNPYKQFYKPFDSGASSPSPCPTPEIKYSNVEPPQIQFDMYKKGYLLVGYSEFNASDVSEAQLSKQATELQACVAVLLKRYSHTQNGYIPIQQYHGGQQVNIQTQGTFSGRQSNVDYRGTTTATTPGYTTTTLLPYQERRSDYFASFWMKIPPSPLGLYLDNIPDEMRRKLNVEKGVIVKAIRDESPADKAGFITEDIIVGYDGTPFSTYKEFSQFIDSKEGKTVVMDILRNGNSMKKTITLGTKS